MRYNYHEKQWKATKIIVAVLFLALLILGMKAFLMSNEDEQIYQVYCLGDSITYGYGLEEDEREQCCYPGRLQELLGSHYEVHNCGASGTTLIDLPGNSYRKTGYIEEVKSHATDILIVMLGTNDSKTGNWNSDKYKKQYIVLVDELKEMESHPQIYIMAPPEAFPLENGEIIYGINNDVIHDEIREILNEVAEETEVEVIDLYEVTENHPEYFVDGVHPNKEGYEVLAQTVYAEIEKEE